MPTVGMVVEMPVNSSTASGTSCFDHATSSTRWHPVIEGTAADDGAWELTDYLDQGMVRHALSKHCWMLLYLTSEKMVVQSASACRAHW